MSTKSLTPTPAVAGRGTLRDLVTSRWAPLPIILAGTFIVVRDFFIVNVALASIQSRLHASSGTLEWIVAAMA